MMKKLVVAVFLVIAQQASPCQTPQLAGTRPPKQMSISSTQKTENQQQHPADTPDTPAMVKPIQPQQANQEASNNQPAGPSDPPKLWGLSDKIAAIASIVALLQFAALVVTVWIMVCNGQRQLRAYVVIERGIIANVANPIPHVGENVTTVARITQPDAGPTVLITIKNTGQTPAYELVHWGRMCVQEFPLTSELPTMPAREGKFWTVMGPGIVEVKTIRLRPLAEAEIQSLHDGTKAVYCHGEIHYRDAFKKRQVTRYRCMYASGISGRIGVGTDMTYCEDGNEAT